MSRPRAALGVAGVAVEATPWDREALAEALARHRATHVFLLIGTTLRQARSEQVSGDPYEAIDHRLTRMLCEAAAATPARPRLIYLSAIGSDPKARSPYTRG